MDEFVIRSSDPDWLGKILKAFGEKKRFRFVDDGEIGINPDDLQTGLKLLAAAAQKGECSWQTILAALVGLGLSAVGIWLVRAAILDPEPTSRLTLLVAGGLILATTGGAAALHALGARFAVRVDDDGVEVKPMG